jgi:hypothetical protein
MGKLYRDAVHLCLKGNFDQANRDIKVAFYMDVVRKLDRRHG